MLFQSTARHPLARGLLESSPHYYSRFQNALPRSLIVVRLFEVSKVSEGGRVLLFVMCVLYHKS